MKAHRLPNRWPPDHAVRPAYTSLDDCSGAIQLKHWKRGPTMYRELRALGATHDVARQVAANSRRWWRNSGSKLLNSVLPIAWIDRLGLPRLS